MKDILSIDYSNFYFNNAWASDYDCEIGSKNGLFPFSPSAPLDIKSEENALGVDGEIVYGADFKPRPFSVPIMLNNLSRLREVSGWLSPKTPQIFYWKNDSVCINAMVNSLSDVERSSLQYGFTELKFIAHDPYYYELVPVDKVYTSFASAITLDNNGNKESFPLMKIEGSGDITVTVNGNSFIVRAVPSVACVDTLYMTCYKDLATPLEDNFEGIYPILNAGNNTISVSGSCTKLTVTCRSRWI